MRHKKDAPPRGVLKVPLADPKRLEHARYHPSPDLDAFVEHFWVVRWDLRGLPAHRAETLPHPSVHMTFSDGVGGRIRGVMRGKFSTLLVGAGDVFAIKFRPGGFQPFVRRPVSAFTDAVVPLRAVWGAEGHALQQAVLTLTDVDARMTIVEDFLRRRHAQHDERSSLAGRIVDAVAGDRTLLTMDDVARRFDVNPRKLQRLFADYVGVNPKWVIRRYRLHEAAEQLARGAASQVSLALALGYADQSHFVKDFKATVGTSPAAYARRARRATSWLSSRLDPRADSV
jgi:AraC-like DNA-binding protein